MDELKPGPNEGWKERIDLNKFLDEITEEQFLERCNEVKTKVRNVLNGVNSARGQVAKCENDLKKAYETYNKGLNKLDQIRKGNWSLLEDKQETKGDG